jgi:hypothetical protein
VIDESGDGSQFAFRSREQLADVGFVRDVTANDEHAGAARGDRLGDSIGPALSWT